MTDSMLTIGALAAQAGVNVETIRFYQRKGIVPVPSRPERGVRNYSKDHVDRVRFIKAAQLWGFTLGEVADLLRLQDGMACDATRRIAEERLAVVTDRMRELRNVAEAFAERSLSAGLGEGACRAHLSHRYGVLGWRGGAVADSVKWRR